MSLQNTNLKNYLDLLAIYNRIELSQKLEDKLLDVLDVMWECLTAKEREEANRNQANTSGT